MGDFTIETDAARKMLRLTTSGFWDMADVERFDGAWRDAFARMRAAGCGPTELFVLIDHRRLGPQTQDVVQRMRMIALESGAAARRTAILVASPLQKRQIERISAGISAATFETEAPALEWLTATG